MSGKLRHARSTRMLVNVAMSNQACILEGGMGVLQADGQPVAKCKDNAV